MRMITNGVDLFLDHAIKHIKLLVACCRIIFEAHFHRHKTSRKQLLAK